MHYLMKGRAFRFLIAIMVSFFFISCLEISCEEKEQSLPYSEQDSLPRLISVIKAETPPVIDGVMDKGEWDRASSITGLIKVPGSEQFGTWGLDNMAETQSTFWITYDDDYLYIAHHSPPPESIKDSPQIIAVMLKSIITQHDSNIDWDDCIAVSIVHPEYPGGDLYSIQVTSIGTTFDCIWGGGHNHSGTIIAWDPEIINASNLTPEGWTIEMAVSWDDLGPHIKKPSAGEVLHMNFARFWREIINENHAWKANNAFEFLPRYLKPAGKVMFQGESGVIVRLKETGSLPTGHASFSADIVNYSGHPRTLLSEIITDSGELSDKQTIEMEPGKSQTYRFEGQVSDFATTEIAFIITDSATGEKLHITSLPVIRPTKPEFFIRRYRSRELSRIETDISFIGSADLKRTSISLTLTDNETGRRVLRETYRGFSLHRPVLEFSTAKIEPGDYTAELVINAPGMSRYETNIEYRHPELPEWWENRYGYEDMDSDIVPYPWTDIIVEEETVKVWGREYIMDGSILPRQITTLGRPMLRGPVRVIAETSSGEVLDTSAIGSESEWTMLNRTRIEGRRTAEASSFSLSNSLWVEYDGLMWNRLTIQPTGRVEISRMVLEIPLTEEFTDVINAIDYSLRATGLVNPGGFADEPTRRVWLGNAEGGIQWFCETNGWFFVREPRQSLRVDVEDGAAVLRIVMVDIPTVFDSPYDMEFGFIATYIARPSTLLPISSRSLTRSHAYRSYFNGYEHIPGYMRGTLDSDFMREGRWLEYMKDRAVIIVYNDSEWEGEMQLEVDWKKLGLGNPESLTATNYLHSTGFRVETALNEDGQEVEKAVFLNRPEEYAKIEDGKLLFPMTRHNACQAQPEENPVFQAEQYHGRRTMVPQGP